jgi:hypothetical protein
LRKLQEVESRDLFPPTDVSGPDLLVQGPALASHAVPASPADCLSQRGYGDDLNIESTRSDKSGSKDWNLLDLRGTEAIQVSRHRGPPTDRPPDKRGGISVFEGCSQERANTHRIHYQLASFARSSHCSSDNVSSLADNAIVGKSRHQAIYCVHAVGTSHEVYRGLSWTPPRCGRFRVNGIRVRA